MSDGRGQKIEVGSRTRRRPKRMGLCRGNDAEGGRKEGEKNLEVGMRKSEKLEGENQN
jgi:hypothetical protein